MGPDNNPALFCKFGKPRVRSIRAETERRDLLPKALAELSYLMDKLDAPYQTVSDPSVFLQIFSLLQLRFTPVSIVGFGALNADALTNKKNDIEARAAPHHDECNLASSDSDEHNPQHVYRTRLVQLKLNSQATDLEIFGLNIYQPQSDIEIPMFDTPSPVIDPEIEKYKEISGKKTEEPKEPGPLIGEIVLFVVYNKKINDAKVYAIKPYYIETDEDDEPLEDNNKGTHFTEAEAISENMGAVIVNGNHFDIEVLTGNLLHEAVFEIHTAIQKLRDEKQGENIVKTS